MARTIESLLRISPHLERMRSAGMELTTVAGTHVIGVRAVPRAGVHEPALYVRLEAEEWWYPGDIERAARLADELTRQLLAEWD